MRLPSIFLLFSLLTLTGCSLLPEQVDKTKDWSANKLYSAAKEQLQQKNYEQAIKYFETLEARYPFGHGFTGMAETESLLRALCVE